MNILLCCNAGMSTSIVVQAMNRAAKAQGKNYKIWAIDADSVDDEDEPIDVILIGPQVGYRLDDIKALMNVPTAVMDRSDYGNCNGEAILKQAEELFVSK